MKSNDHLETKDYSFLDTFDSIDEEKDWQNVKAQMKQKKTMILPAMWKVAAGIAVLLGIGYLAIQLVAGGPEIMQAKAGDRVREISLPDGSLVVLNRGAILSWPEVFEGRKRQVTLKGEAWFEVNSNPERPFLVNVADRALVEVLGTRFNVKADSLRSSIRVQVEEGRVAFSGTGSSSPDGTGMRMVLAAGEGAAMDHHGIITAEKVDPNELGWRTGILVFDQHSLSQVAAILEASYGTIIEVDPQIPKELEFTSIIRSEDLETVLEEVCLVLDLAYERTGEKVLLRPAP